jgi:hypothetical protein
MIGFIQDERTARKILDHLGLPSRPPPRGPRLRRASRRCGGSRLSMMPRST